MAATASGTTNAGVPVPGSKTQRYDRQLRLWGDHGQAALEDAHICVINAGAVGTETLKNLILPGVGAITIVDEHVVQQADLGNNFFLAPEHLGQSRAEVAVTFLQELNEEVRSESIAESPSTILASDPGFFQKFSMVVATQLPEPTLVTLASSLWEHDIPLLVLRAYGMIAYMQMVLREHTVIESHPDDSLSDLRLYQPFPALVALAEEFGPLETMDNEKHSHTPFLIVLYQYLQKWKAEHGSLPSCYADKKKLQALIVEGVRQKDTGEALDELNFDEARRNVNTLGPPKIPSDVKAIIQDPKAQTTDAETPVFWVLARALKDFVEEYGVLPLPGSLPDMTADTNRYVQLQQAYQSKAQEDQAVVAARVHELLCEVGLPVDRVPDHVIRLFCKNAHFLRLSRGKSLAEVDQQIQVDASSIDQQLEDPDNKVKLFLLLRATERFRSCHGHYPGEFDEQFEEDVSLLKTTVASLLSEWGISASIAEDQIQEVCRYGASELHNVASFLGGACTDLGRDDPNVNAQAENSALSTPTRTGSSHTPTQAFSPFHCRMCRSRSD
eukprot:m.68758 g.68758  ORF g.68758 m.68758 type:complete len:557 (-) comp13926_c0_seq2:267-1937(-)